MEVKNDNLVAEGIAENLLYRTGLALSYGRYDGVEDCFTLPQTLETLEGARIVRTPEDVREVFEAVRTYFREIEVVDVVRTIVESRFASETEIESIHVSSLIKRDASTTTPPYPVFNLLKRCEDGAWRIAHSHYAIPNSRDHNSALLAWRAKANPNATESL